MTIEDRKKHFIELGNFLALFGKDPEKSGHIPSQYQTFFNELNQKIDSAVHYNGWFTRENVMFSLDQWSKALSPQQLDQWLDGYSFRTTGPKTVAVVMAGNIPLVGFHDFISVLLAGHRVLVKLSSNDNQLLPMISDVLGHIAPVYQDRIRFTSEKLEGFDAVIATGSNNTARYFEYYFSGVPNIIRKNRNSVAILSGEESREDLETLGEDIFRYYGLGCRNVSKIFVPQTYEFKDFFEAIYPWNPIIHQAKYANNYDYNKAVYLMSEFPLLDNGFLILKEDTGLGSPIATLFYERYSNPDQLKGRLEKEQDQLQCVVRNVPKKGEVLMGQTQQPKLWDYADQVDTLEFLLQL